MRNPGESAGRILIVDDDHESLELLRRLLSSKDYDVSVESNPVDAVERMKKERFAVVLTDIVMPEMTGLEVLKSVMEANRATQVILMTGFSTMDKVIDAYSLGASDYLFKPFEDLDEVVEAVGNAVYRYRRWFRAIKKALSFAAKEAQTKKE